MKKIGTLKNIKIESHMTHFQYIYFLICFLSFVFGYTSSLFALAIEINFSKNNVYYHQNNSP